jgi:hypothetical protein
MLFGNKKSKENEQLTRIEARLTELETKFESLYTFKKHMDAYCQRNTNDICGLIDSVAPICLAIEKFDKDLNELFQAVAIICEELSKHKSTTKYPTVSSDEKKNLPN